MANTKLQPLNIDTSKPEPVVELNKKLFERLQWLYNRNIWTKEELDEWKSLIHLVFHTHDSEDDNG